MRKREGWARLRARRRHGFWSGGDYMYGFPPQVSVAERRAEALDRLNRLRKTGRPVSPVAIEGRQIAETFWGRAWCENLERYSDFANRLPRGRSYVRNGSVVDLQVAPGVVNALVSGSDLYEVRVAVAGLPKIRWRAVCTDVSGSIDSVVELLQGRLSRPVMTRVCAEGTGLFPAPREVQFTCSCPDAALMCKHVAAVLYGIGARLDRAPELLFTLRRVDASELVGGAGARAAAALVSGRPGDRRSRRIVDDGSLSDVFGIELAPANDHKAAARTKARPRRRTKT